MNNQEIIDFFNKYAPTWDEHMIKNTQTINKILDSAKVFSGVSVLDVACGTGVLIPDYLERKVKSITAVDISDEMIKIAEKKFKVEPSISIICGDVLETELMDSYDCIIVYNAFPHFPEPQALINKLAKLLSPGGTLTIAHGMSREQLLKHHSGEAKNISLPLPEIDELAKMFPKSLTVTTKISDDNMYLITGKKAFMD